MPSTVIVKFLWWYGVVLLLPVKASFGLPVTADEIRHLQVGVDGIVSFVDSIGPGACVLDINHDGFPDVVQISGDGSKRHYGKVTWWGTEQTISLYENRSGLSLELDSRYQFPQIKGALGCAVADLDNDGVRELVINAYGGIFLLSRANSQFEFELVEKFLNPGKLSTGIAISDYDRDGLLDLYVTNYVDFDLHSFTFENDYGVSVNNDRYFEQELYPPALNQLFKNTGELVFQEVAAAMGVSNPDGRSLSALWHDVNGDGWDDLLVANDRPSESVVYINRQQLEGFVVSENTDRMMKMSGVRTATLSPFHAEGIFYTRGQGDYNQLVDIGGTGGGSTTFESLLKFSNAQSSWGTAVADFNNDRNLDLYIANGSLQPDGTSHFVPIGQKNVLFLSNDAGGWNRIVENGFPYSSRAALALDFDLDGALEVLVTNNNGPLQLFSPEIQNPGNWISIAFDRNLLDVEISGANIELTVGAATIRRTYRFEQSFMSSGTQALHVGLGDAEVVDRVVVKFLNGTDFYVENVSANQHYIVNDIGFLRQSQSIAQLQLDEIIEHLDNESYVELASIVSWGDGVEEDFGNDNGNKLLLNWIWSNADTSSKRALLTRFADTKSKTLLPMIKDALRSEDLAVKVAAINALRVLELPQTVEWLIPLLDSDSDKIVCAVARVMEYLFTEEEAVPTVKMLAISPLLRRSTRGSALTQACIIRSLAAAESERSVTYLNGLVQTDVDLSVQLAAIRALGMIRDTRAVPVLIELLEAEKSVSIFTAALIALARLDKTKAESVLVASFEMFTLSEKARALYQLTKTQDGLAISGQLLSAIADEVVGECNDTVLDQLETEPLMGVSILREELNIKTLGQCLIMLDESNSAISQMFVVALGTNNAELASLVSRYILELDSEQLTEFLGTEGLPVLSDVVLKEISRNYGLSVQTAENSLLLVDRLERSSGVKLLNHLMGNDLSSKAIKNLLRVCRKNALGNPNLPDRWRKSNSSVIAISWISCWLSDPAPRFQVTGPSVLSTNRLIREIRQAGSQGIVNRQKLDLLKLDASRKSSEVAVRLLPELFQSRSVKTRLKAIRLSRTYAELLEVQLVSLYSDVTSLIEKIAIVNSLAATSSMPELRKKLVLEIVRDYS